MTMMTMKITIQQSQLPEHQDRLGVEVARNSIHSEQRVKYHVSHCYYHYVLLILYNAVSEIEADPLEQILRNHPTKTLMRQKPASSLRTAQKSSAQLD